MARILRSEHVHEVRNMPGALEAMERAFALEGQGRTGRPQRIDVPTGNGWLRLMPVVVEGLGVFGFKAMNLVPHVGVRYALHIYDLADGSLLGILDAQLMTTLRTAATAAIAARRLSNDPVERVAMIGTGVEARTLLEAMQLVRPSASVAVFSRGPENRRRFIDDMGQVIAAELVEASSVEEATADAGIILLATKSSAPVLLAEHIHRGVHVSSIGSARLDQFEVAPDAFRRFDVVVCDSVEHVATEAGDAKAAVSEGSWDPSTALDLCRLVVGERPVTEPAGVTLFKSVGTATQDLALGVEVLAAATQKGLGIELDGFPHMKSLEKAPTRGSDQPAEPSRATREEQ